RVADVTGVRPEYLRLQALRRVGEDFAGGRVGEERVGVPGDLRLVPQHLVGREVALLREQPLLLVRVGQPLRQRDGFLLVLARGGNGQVRAAPVAATGTRDLRQVP